MSLPSLKVEVLGQELQNGRQFSWAKMLKEDIKLSDIHWLAAVCAEKAPVHSSGKETAQAAVHEWYCNTAKE